MKGCERIKIKALLPMNAGVSDCTAAAYPRFAERATVHVPMPRKLVGAQLVSGCCEPRPPPSVAPTPKPGSLGHVLSSTALPVPGAGEPREVTRGTLGSSDLTTTPGLFVSQKTKDHFLEVKMESSRQRFFHLHNDFAYIEVSNFSPC